MTHNTDIKGVDVMFRTYNFGDLMGSLTKNSLTEKQEITLRDLLSKIQLTPTQAKERDRLVAKRDALPELSETAKTLVKDYFNSLVRGTSKMHLSNKYLEKGKQLENMALARIAKVNGWQAPLNANKLGIDLTDEYGYGHPDAMYKNLGFGFDAKCSFSDQTFPLFAKDLKEAAKTSFQRYEWQAKRYAMIAGFDHWYVCFSLENTPEQLIVNESWKLWKESGNEGQPDESFINEVREMHNFDHLPDWARVKTFRVDLTESDREKVKEHVILARNYFDELKEQYLLNKK
jgi:hypothetical protein